MTLPAGYTIRPATAADAELIQAHREAMFSDMGEDAQKLALGRETGLAWHRRMLEGGTYTGLLLEQNGRVVGGAGILWQDLPPNAHTLGMRAYIMNVYVGPQHRGQKLAQMLMQEVLAECQRRGVNVITLTASDAGRPIYEKLGFKPQAEMRLVQEVSP